MSALVQPSEIHRVSVEEYHRMIESGGLDEDTRVELIDGPVVDMRARSPEHENALRWPRDRDLRTKPAIYAPHVAEYWVVDLERGCAVVRRDPGEDGYRDVSIAARGERLAPRAVTIGALDTDALLAAAFAERA